MTLRERMKIDRDLRHKARRKLRVKAGNGSGTQVIIEKFRKQNLVKV